MATIVDTAAAAGTAPGSPSWAATPTRPATAKTITIGSGRRTDALPTIHPIKRATPTMQLVSTALSAVPNVEIANVLSHDGEWSMTKPPIAEIADGTAVDHPARSSVAPRPTATPATPAHPDRRRAISMLADAFTVPLKSLRGSAAAFNHRHRDPCRVASASREFRCSACRPEGATPRRRDSRPDRARIEDDRSRHVNLVEVRGFEPLTPTLRTRQERVGPEGQQQGEEIRDRIGLESKTTVHGT